MKRTALAVILLLVAPEGRGEDRVVPSATLNTRLTLLERRPDTEVLFDPARLTFALDGYLVPDGRERILSVVAGLALDGTHLGGDLRWRLGLDSGEVQRVRRPELVEVCWSRTGTGLDLPGSGSCRLVVVPLESVARGAAELASNGRAFADEASATWLVRDAWASLAFGRAGFAAVRAGRSRTTVGDGLVHDDYAAGVELGLDLGSVGPPFDVAVAVLTPSRQWPGGGDPASPMAVARIDWLPSLFERAGLFAAVFRDDGDSIAQTARGLVVERLAMRLARAQALPGSSADEVAVARTLAVALGARYRSEATLGWLGTSGRLSPWRGHRIGWTAAALGGRLDTLSVRAGELARDVTLRGRALSATWDLELPRGLEAGVSFLFLSGGSIPVGTLEYQENGPGLADDRVVAHPATGTYHGFLGVAPFIPYTGLFFGGGLSETFAARQATAPGVNGRGVLAPAARLAFDPSETVSLEAKVAWLRADVEGPYGGKAYGWEADLTGSVSPAPWLTLGLELDALWPGDFYGGRDTVYKAVLAVDVVTP